VQGTRERGGTDVSDVVVAAIAWLILAVVTVGCLNLAKALYKRR